MKTRYMTLDADHNLIPTDDVREWGKAFEDGKVRTVAKEEAGGYGVSTVFLGIDQSYGDGPSTWFETMLFSRGGGPQERDQETYRYTTWAEAEAGHNRLVEELSE